MIGARKAESEGEMKKKMRTEIRVLEAIGSGKSEIEGCSWGKGSLKYKQFRCGFFRPFRGRKPEFLAISLEDEDEGGQSA